MQEKAGEEEMERESSVPPLMALNHVSRLCRDVNKSVRFYTEVLGMVPVERPEVLDFEGAWLFNYGIGIHLVQAEDEERLPPRWKELDPKDNHISFQCEDIGAMEERLKKHGVRYMKRAMEDDEKGAKIDQIFFKDPDGFMVEICNCENLEVVPADGSGTGNQTHHHHHRQLKLPSDRHNPPIGIAPAAPARS